jgi:hypothetical protein
MLPVAAPYGAKRPDVAAAVALWVLLLLLRRRRRCAQRRVLTALASAPRRAHLSLPPLSRAARQRVPGAPRDHIGPLLFGGDEGGGAIRLARRGGARSPPPGEAGEPTQPPSPPLPPTRETDGDATDPR